MMDSKIWEMEVIEGNSAEDGNEDAFTFTDTKTSERSRRLVVTETSRGRRNDLILSEHRQPRQLQTWT